MSRISSRVLQGSIAALYVSALIGLTLLGLAQIGYVLLTPAPLSGLWNAGPPLIFALLLYLFGLMQVM